MGFKRPAAHELAAYRCSLPGLAGFTGSVAQGSNPTRLNRREYNTGLAARAERVHPADLAAPGEMGEDAKGPGVPRLSPHGLLVLLGPLLWPVIY